jgi:hypothetical protein
MSAKRLGLKFSILLFGILAGIWVTPSSAQSLQVRGSTVLYEDELQLIQGALERREELHRPSSNERGFSPEIRCRVGSEQCAVATYFSTIYCSPNHPNCGISTDRTLALSESWGVVRLSFAEVHSMITDLRNSIHSTPFSHMDMSRSDLAVGAMRARCWSEARCSGFFSCRLRTQRGCTLFLDPSSN